MYFAIVTEERIIDFFANEEKCVQLTVDLQVYPCHDIGIINMRRLFVRRHVHLHEYRLVIIYIYEVYKINRSHAHMSVKMRRKRFIQK